MSNYFQKAELVARLKAAGFELEQSPVRIQEDAARYVLDFRWSTYRIDRATGDVLCWVRDSSWYLVTGHPDLGPNPSARAISRHIDTLLGRTVQAAA